jgi:hypothetical protein
MYHPEKYLQVMLKLTSSRLSELSYYPDKYFNPASTNFTSQLTN